MSFEIKAEGIDVDGVRLTVLDMERNRVDRIDVSLT